MTRKIVTLRIIGAFFLLSTVVTSFTCLHSGAAPPVETGKAMFYLTVMTVIGISLLLRRPWARPAAIVALAYKTAQFAIFSFRDAGRVDPHATDILSTMIPYLIMTPIIALLLAAIRWLTLPGTRELFHRDTGIH